MSQLTIRDRQVMKWLQTPDPKRLPGHARPMPEYLWLPLERAIKRGLLKRQPDGKVVLTRKGRRLYRATDLPHPNRPKRTMRVVADDAIRERRTA